MCHLAPYPLSYLAALKGPPGHWRAPLALAPSGGCGWCQGWGRVEMLGTKKIDAGSRRATNYNKPILSFSRFITASFDRAQGHALPYTRNVCVALTILSFWPNATCTHIYFRVRILFVHESGLVLLR